MSAARNSTSHLLSGRLLARNSLWNLVGQMLPMAVGLVAVPPLVKALGVSQFGILSLAWVVIGYFSFVDLGIGRAVTKLVADKTGAQKEHEIPPLAWTSIALLLLLGIFGGVVTSLMSPWLVHSVLKVPPALQPETVTTFLLLASSIPLVTLTSGLRGILEALQRFRLLNLIRIPSSTFSFAGPLLVLPFSHRLVPVMMVLVLGRLITGLAHLIACFRAMPALRTGFSFSRTEVMPLMKFGGWITVSNLVAPFLTYIDRLLIGALLSVGAVAYYSAPYDVMIRLTVIPAAVVGVLFPAFSVGFARDAGRTSLLFSRGTKYVFLAMFPIILLVVALAPEGLRLWLGTTFAHNSTSALRWLAAGVLVNAISFLPYVLIQSAGKPDFTARLHLAELAPYLVLLWMLTKKLGIEGTAIAWFARVTVDAAILFIRTYGMLPDRMVFFAKLSGALAVAGGLLCAVALPGSLLARILLLVAALSVFAAAGWFWGLSPAERVFLTGSRKAANPGLA
ncbi:MAG TPA: flippase [Candidatus Angelobacter sp.]|nr:flippase [Candidatus Angelobacter sp.]